MLAIVEIVSNEIRDLYDLSVPGVWQMAYKYRDKWQNRSLAAGLDLTQCRFALRLI